MKDKLIIIHNVTLPMEAHFTDAFVIRMSEDMYKEKGRQLIDEFIEETFSRSWKDTTDKTYEFRVFTLPFLVEIEEKLDKDFREGDN